MTERLKKLTELSSLRSIVIACFIIALPAFIALVRPGFFSMQDDLQAFRLYEMHECFKDRQIPCRWVPNAGFQYGYPQFNYYAPGVYYLGEMIHLMGFQFIDTVKILFVLGFIIGAVGMYLVSGAVLGKLPGIVSAILFTYAPFRAQEVYVRGALSEFWAVSLFPFTLWASHRLVLAAKSKVRYRTAVFAILLAFLLVTHSLLPLVFAPIILAWAIFWLWQTGGWQRLKDLVLSGIFALGISAFFMLPMIFERGYVHVESILGGYFDYRIHFVSVRQLFLDNNFGYGSSVAGPGDDLSISSGIVLIGSWIAALILTFINRKKQSHIWKLTLVLSVLTLTFLFLMHAKSSFIWQNVPVLPWLQFPWRFLSITVVLLSVMSGVVVYLSGRWKNIVALTLASLAVLINFSFFQPKDWIILTDEDKFSGESWQRQLTISIFDYLPKAAEKPPKEKAPEAPEILSGEALVTEYNKGSNWQGGIITSVTNATVRLPIYDFPEMEVRLNGQKITHDSDNCSGQPYCYGLVTVNIPPGEHHLEVRLKDTLIRKIANAISLVTIPALFLYLKKND